MNNRRSNDRLSLFRDRGQAIILIALGFVVLLGFAGLVVDVARVFVARGSLRRAVDAAGLAAAAQFRLNADPVNIQNAARQFIYAHGIVDDASTFYDMAVVTSTLRVDTCGTAPTDTSLCTTPLKRKLVRIRAEANVSMTFLQLLGVSTVKVTTDSLSEAAAVDVVLVLDSSISQAYDAGSMNAWLNTQTPTVTIVDGTDPDTLACDPDSFKHLGGAGSDGILYSNANHWQNACAEACNADLACRPLQDVKSAAKSFIDQLYQDYDRVAIVTIERQPQSKFSLSTNLQGAKDAIDAMKVSDHSPWPGETPGEPCPFIDTIGSRWRCASSNMGGALIAGANEFRTTPIREDSLWVMIVLGSGGADTTDIFPSTFQTDAIQYGVCPYGDTLPFCRDTRWSTHNFSNTQWYDAEDFAYDQANYVGLDPTKSFPLLGRPQGGAGILVYTIGLGKKVVCTSLTDSYSKGPPVVCVPNAANQYVDPDTKISPHLAGYSNGAESFLRYLADIGDDADPTTTPCHSTSPAADAMPLGAQCGNYYFAPEASGLQAIFLAIAGKIFTRLSG
jgi:Flp pilus assembly protein TadG